MREATGTVLRYIGDQNGAAIALHLDDGCRVNLLVAPAVVNALTEKYAVPQPDGCLDMAPFIGLRVRFVESATGIITKLSLVE
ncbi:hypothetical protein [Anaeromyxobacter paludicola]|uniref:Uncharacterized protein n=1 Tax=Anaeromyxobacter paludicola TaxID=2918171 RepID=A0ABN6N8F3_9BACT|nr:hypothetical protein [Anaeromyxobacter paludicola]BDG08227.1 hypothetical protein AMPC_13400 [Anaeromyxobacter paludicola]